MKIKELIKKAAVISFTGALIFSMTGCGATETSNTNTPTPAAAETETPSVETEAPTSEGSSLDKDTLVLGFDDTFAPMGFKDENGEIVGFDIDLANAICEEMGKKVEFQCIDWSMKEAELNNGNIDFIWNGYSITDERKEQVDFGTPYLKNRQIVVTMADSDINTLADLAGKSVGAQAQSSAEEAINSKPEIRDTFTDGKAITYESNNDVLMDLEAGRLDAAVADEILVRYYINKKGADKYKVLDEDFGEEEYGVGMRKGDTALVNAFNTAYAKLKEEGKLAEISTKWFGEDITE